MANIRLAFWQFPFAVFFVISLLHRRISPYTKVEESFNLQAIHDILEYGVPTSNATSKFQERFDHMTFPGAVPRSFIGSIVIAAFAKPEIWLSDLAGKAAQNHVRSVLGTFNTAALTYFASSVERAYGPTVGTWYVVLQASQFHLWYYASRTLPNMFAFFLSTLGLATLLPNSTSSLGPAKRARLGLYYLTMATVIFRSELALLLATSCLWMLLKPQTLAGKVRLFNTVLVPGIIPGALLALLLTVAIDSYFWQSKNLLWPELSAFLSNIFPDSDHEGASAWGTQPFYWYLFVALPRLLMNQIFMVDLLFLSSSTWSDLRVLDNLIPSYAYVLLYSILPHKETRFLFPVVPTLTLVAALTCTRLTFNAHKQPLTKIFYYTAIGSTMLAAFVSHAILLPLSALNYPGAEALVKLHEHHQSQGYQQITGSNLNFKNPVINVHLTNLALQSGITRFLEQHPPLPPAEVYTAKPRMFKLQVHDQQTDIREPLILPGDSNHPALTITPQSPQSSGTPSSLPAETVTNNLHLPEWRYDKTSNSTEFLHPLFWSAFDYLIVETPSQALGAWSRISEIRALGQPTILLPDQDMVPRYRIAGRWKSPDELITYWSTPYESCSTAALLHAMYPAFISAPLSHILDLAHDIFRLGLYSPIGAVTGGYWIEVPLVTKLHILKRGDELQPLADRMGRKKQGEYDSTNFKSLDVDEDTKDSGEVLGLPEKVSSEQQSTGIGELGPLVVNKDGTLSRLDNWEQMTLQEKKRTMEYLRKRNMLRLEEFETVAA